ncbi:hypothetical protein AB1286_16100 [Trinickia sp. NRRL B-1857]|uniref:hypothetical protein n=1 Tax=Trinickia sp. NRRL B-1857 TaxID=3162879 RepID=UPI003D2E1AE1
MYKINRVFLDFMFVAICVNCGESSAQGACKAFSDEYVLFYYPENRYSKVQFGGVTEEGFYAYYLKVKGSDAEDILTVCKASLDHCGLDTGSVKPYWYSDDGSLMLFSATTTVKKKEVGSGKVAYEAFPACPATDSEGPSAYGGDCYELVEAGRNETLSITYWIGPKSLHRSKENAVKRATVILKSVVVK